MQGIAWLADRFPFGPWGRGWGASLVTSVTDGTLKKREIAVVRAWATARIAGEAWALEGADLLRVFDKWRVPESVGVRLVELYLGDVAYHVLELLLPESRAIDRLLVRDMHESLAKGDYERLARATQLALKRKAKGAAALAKKLLDELEAPGAGPAVAACAGGLDKLKLLPKDWWHAALSRPERIRFDVAAHRTMDGMTRVERKLLIVALESDAREGRAAIAALTALAFQKSKKSRMHVRFDDPRIARALSSAPLDARLDAVTWLVLMNAPTPVLAPHFEALLTRDDDDLFEAQWHLVDLMNSRSNKAWLRQALPRVADPFLHQHIRDHLGLGSEYWQDGVKRADRGEN